MVALAALALAACGTSSDTTGGDEGSGSDVQGDNHEPDDVVGNDTLGKDTALDAPAPDGAGDDVAPQDTASWECADDAGCDDGDECTSDWCDDQHACQHMPRAGWCHLAGACVEAGSVNPDNPCEACQPLVKTDAYSADDTLPCGTDDACSTHACRAGACVALPLLDCDDQNPCTDDGCEAGAGCVHQANSASCDDGDVCTQGDACAGGACVAGAKQLSCDDGNLCTTDTCQPATGCAHFANDVACDDANSCTVNDRCAEGVCAGVPSSECDDQNPCTDDWCDPVHGCLHRDNAAACDDADPCTVGDRCVGMACVPGDQPLPCDDGDGCTDDFCTPGVGCQTTFNAAPCDDQNACTENDTCAQGFCQGSHITCDDANPCTEDYCNPYVGCGTNPQTGTYCDDGLTCTTYDTCDLGTCKGQALPCDDGNDCTLDGCVEPGGCFGALNTEQAGCDFQVVVENPPRGVTLDPTALTDGAILVTGYVDSPADGAPVLTLNGNAVPLTAVAPNDPPQEGEVNPGQAKRFTFAVPVTPEQAMNILDVQATDKFERKAGRVQTFYYSTVYYPTESGVFDTQKVANGMGVALTQTFLDDNDPDLDDLASIVDLIFGGLDIKSLLGTGVLAHFEQGAIWTTCKYDVYVDNVTFAGTGTDLRILADGLGLNETIYNLHVQFRLDRVGGVFPCPDDFSGTADADSALISTSLNVKVENGQLTATVANSSTTMNGLDVNVDAWFNFVIGLLQGTIQGALEDAVTSAINDQVAPLISDALTMLNLSLPFEIPALFPGMTPTTVTLQTKVSSVGFVPDVSMMVGMDGAALSEYKTPYHPLGSIGYANCLGAPFTGNTIDFGALSPLDIGLFDDVLNQIVHAVYQAGLLELVLGPDVIPADQLAQYGVSNLNVALSGMLPPVVTMCKSTPSGQDVPGAMVLEIGDLGVDASFSMNGSDVAMSLYATVRGGVALQVTTDPDTGATKVGIRILGLDTVKTDLIDVQSDDPTMKELVANLISSTLLPMLLGGLDLGDALSFELPVLDLSGLSDMVPAGTALKIVPEAIERTTNANTLVKASVTAATLPTP